uniref:Ribosomal RNA small subunit methyltransferase I n=1 Tax=Candidatus Kentrum sp. SD TaxID=2126332 RepID=A0A450YND3_9GAMM|nr:MAG: 16S rRNA (cytidine1402-2'-O)-methyltransferase [Candidatus Kentron sp. SD]VFK43035.1 MAG: 16S rRNA (cytidine1402-2'-O)-methyltransferase [Candidatus Kentron sp. SD]VFK78609.1 MAG: 16S rRNA (cytidine1402-2'-O)-methyltransferase [Candidatus Kentron sp. SD]
MMHQAMAAIESGILYVVATPIGNLDDIAPRALRVLGEVDLILAEDTRVSARLLRRFGIATPVRAFHEHNERRMAPDIVAQIERGARIALISDAGTPLLSDPGFHLTRLLHERNRKIVPIPGPSALICALSASGLPTDRFIFEGFLPSKQEARRHRLQGLAEETRTLILYESPHRIRETIRDMTEIFGDQRPGVIARELTKTFETIRSDSLATLAGWLLEDENHQRGEFVLMIGGKPKPDPARDEAITTEDLRALRLLLEELPLKKAVALAARLTGRKKNALYRLALAMNEP